MFAPRFLRGGLLTVGFPKPLRVVAQPFGLVQRFQLTHSPTLFQRSQRWYATFRDSPRRQRLRRAAPPAVETPQLNVFSVEPAPQSLHSRSRSYGGVPPFWKDPKNLRTLKRITIFTVGFCCITHFAAPYVFAYAPGASYLKTHPQYLIYGLIAMNLAVFGLWRIPACYRTLQRYFLLEKDNIGARSALIGSAFSHQDFWHLAMNMMALYSFGPALVSWIGVSQFTVLYLNSCVISSFVAILLPMMTRTSLHVASLGASGAIFSVFGTFACMFPTAGISLFFFPIPGGAWVAFLGSIAVNAAGFFMRWGAVDYAAHLGGSLAGLYYGYVCSKQVQKKMESRRRLF